MSNQWSSGQFQTGLPSHGNQVRMFDPTQFQTPATQGGSPSGKPRLHTRQASAGTIAAAHAPPLEATQSSWSSWNSWSTEPSSFPGDSQQQQQTQQLNLGDAVGANQYYSGNQYTGDWNQSWDVSSQYSQPHQTYAPPDTGVGYQSQDLHQQQQQPQYVPSQQNSGVYGQGQYEGNTYGQGQYEGNTYSQEHFAHDPSIQSQQQNLQSQHLYSTQQMSQAAGDQGQGYQPGHELYQGHAEALYNNPYGDNIWTTSGESVPWGDGNGQQVPQSIKAAGLEPQAANEQQQMYVSQTPTSTSIPPPAPNISYSSHNSGLSAPNLDAYTADDDGTVSGFFGKDDDGGIHLNKQVNSSSVLNNPLNSSVKFHSPVSETGSAGLSTFSVSNSGTGDKYVHSTRDVHLTQREQDEQGRSVGNLLTEGTPLVEHSQVDAGVHHSCNTGVQMQTREELNRAFHNPPTLPLNTNIRPTSPDGDHPDSSGSGGSGTSGGSSGLTDWEIVPPQGGPLTAGHTICLDSRGNTHTDSTGGSGDMLHSYEHLEHQIHPSQTSESQSYFNTSASAAASLAQSWDPQQHSSVGDTSVAATVAYSHSFQESEGHVGRSSGEPGHVGRSSGEPGLDGCSSGEPGHVGRLLGESGGHQKGDSTHCQAQPTSQKQNTTFVVGGRSPRHADITQSVTSPNPPSSTSLTSRGDASVAEYRSTTSTNHNALQRDARMNPTAPTKAKLLPSSSAEDGNCVSRPDSDYMANSRDRNSSRSTSHKREDASTSRHQQQQQHQSAFHPVGRQHQTVSPSSPSWDSSEQATPNILLAPVVPLVIPALNPYSVAAATVNAATSSTTNRTSEPEQVEAKLETNKAQNKAGGMEKGNREQRHKYHPRNEEEEKNHSFDSMEEIDSAVKGQRGKSYTNEQSKYTETSYAQKYEKQEPDRYKSDKRSSRNHQITSQQDRDDRYQYDQPASRTDRYSKDEDYRRYHNYYSDYGDSSSDERYDRPRSRQDESRSSRPLSRSGQEAAVPRSREDYDRARDYYERDRYRGYGYDSYSRNLDYYNEERERYYRYSKEKKARLTQAYYEEYYGAQYAEYYKQLEQHHRQQQQQQQLLQHQRSQEGRLSSQELDGSSSSHSQSRGSTPGIGPSPGPEQYGDGRNSRPTSRTDYSRDYYSRGYSYQDYLAYYDKYGYDPYDPYGYSYPGYPDYKQGYDQGRMTPPKHSYSHVRACFGPGGQLVKVLPNRPQDGQPALVLVQDIQTILESCPEAEELRKFPGPLARNTSHKKDVLLFCQEQARACADNVNMMDRESAQLVWRFLELLIKQNGSAVGTDLSDLLLEGHEPSTHEYSLHGMRISQSPEGLDTVPEGNSDDGSSARASPAPRVSSDRTVINNSIDGQMEKWVDRFRHLLLYGRKKDALECAMKNNLWGHALFLASKMDTRTHANVMTRFANSAMRMNDPLQTLYQLMSARQPAAVTCVVDERWGDWRPHLAMILSNQSLKNDLHLKSISTLGDTLATKGCLYASHFCYLMAQVAFGNYFNKTSKIVLIGSSHSLPMEKFAVNEAIQCTEVYEYAQTLGNSAYCLPHLQIYKYLYACRLADYGMISEAIAYCEVIASNLQQNPTCFQPPFVSLVCQLLRKLQYADPHGQMSGDGVDSQVWVQRLEEISAAFENGSIQPLSGTVTQNGLQGPTPNTGSGEYSQLMYSSGGGAAAATDGRSGVATAGVYGHQTLAALHSNGQAVDAVSSELQNLNITDQSLQQQQQQQQIYNQQQGYGQQQEYTHSLQEGYSQHQQASGQFQQHSEISHQQQQYSYSSWQQQQYGHQLDTSTTPLASQGWHATQEVDPWGLPARASISTNEVSEGDDDEDDDDDVDGDDHVIDNSTSGFDYFGNVGSQKVVAPPHRYRTVSGSSAGSTRRGRTMSGSSTGSVKAAPHKPSSQQQHVKGGDKPGHQESGGSGWFGGLFSKLKPKGKNEMILPDDKNPSIVWDPAKKKWMNADGTEEVDNPRAPPPKDTDLVAKPLPAGSAAIGQGPSPLPPSSQAGSNKFSLKATGTRNQYVDISNPKPTGQNMLSTAPEGNSSAVTTSHAPAAGLPQVYPTTPEGNSSAVTASHAPPAGAPQMYPTALGHVDMTNVDSSLHGQQHHLGTHLTGHNTESSPLSSAATATAAQQTSSMPVLFNPAVLKSGTFPATAPPTSTTRPGLKYGQRRTYPK